MQDTCSVSPHQITILIFNDYFKIDFICTGGPGHLILNTKCNYVDEHCQSASQSWRDENAIFECVKIYSLNVKVVKLTPKLFMREEKSEISLAALRCKLLAILKD